jgi:hypothetical protein
MHWDILDEKRNKILPLLTLIVDIKLLLYE